MISLGWLGELVFELWRGVEGELARVDDDAADGSTMSTNPLSTQERDKSAWHQQAQAQEAHLGERLDDNVGAQLDRCGDRSTSTKRVVDDQRNLMLVSELSKSRNVENGEGRVGDSFDVCARRRGSGLWLTQC